MLNDISYILFNKIIFVHNSAYFLLYSIDNQCLQLFIRNTNTNQIYFSSCSMKKFVYLHKVKIHNYFLLCLVGKSLML